MNRFADMGIGVPSGGVVDDLIKQYTVQAGSSLSVGNFVEFVNGQVKKTVATAVSGNAAPQTIGQAANTGSTRPAVLPYGKNRAIVAYSNSTDTTGGLKVGIINITGATISPDTPIRIDVRCNVHDMIFISPTRLAIFISTHTSPFGVAVTAGTHVVIVDISGTTLTYVTIHTLDASYNASGGSAIALGNNDFMFMYECNNGTTFYIKNVAGKINADNTLTKGAILSGNSSSSTVTSGKLLKCTNGKIVHTVYSANGSSGRIAELTYDPTTYTITKPQDIAIGVGTGINHVIELPNNKVMVVGIVGQLKCMMVDITPATYALGTVYTIDSVSKGYPQGNIIIPDPTKPYEVYAIKNSTVSPHPHYLYKLVGADNMTITAAINAQEMINYQALTTTTPSMIMVDTTLMLYAHGSTVEAGKVIGYFITFATTTPSTSITDPQNPQGIAINAAASGQNASIALQNTIVKGLSGLIPGTKYYCSTTGALTTAANDGNVINPFVGIAISSTELVAYNLTTYPGINLGSYATIQRNHTISGSATVGYLVKLNTDGTISNYNGAGVPYGMHISSGVVVLKGKAKALTGLITGEKYYVTPTGALTTTKESGLFFIGYAISDTELFIPDYILKNV
jgi:hypothetical protein